MNKQKFECTLGRCHYEVFAAYMKWQHDDETIPKQYAVILMCPFCKKIKEIAPYGIFNSLDNFIEEMFPKTREAFVNEVTQKQTFFGSRAQKCNPDIWGHPEVIEYKKI